MSKDTGIWIDKRNALIVTLIDGNENLEKISSSVEEYNTKGGSRSKAKYGPQNVVHDSKYTEREKKQMKDYFQEIEERVSDSDQIVIFGPAETGKKLYSEWSDSNPNLFKKVKDLKTADSMTDNQVKAWVRNYFEN